MDLRQQRLDILRRVESGELDLAEGSRLLAALENSAAGSPAAEPAPRTVNPVEVVIPPAARAVVSAVSELQPVPPPLVPSPQTEPLPEGSVSQPLPEPDLLKAGLPRRQGWRSLWVVVFMLGLLLTLVSTNWIFLGFTAAGLSWGFWLSFFPLALGILLLWAGWEMRYARWLNIHIQQADGSHPRTILFGLPLPIGLTRWAVQRFGHYSPVSGQDLGEFLDEMDRSINDGSPVQVFVNGDSGSRVEIWIDGPTL